MSKRKTLTCGKKAAGWRSPLVVGDGYASASPCPECGVIHGRTVAEVVEAALATRPTYELVCDRVQHAHLGYCVHCVGGAS